jgi:hypothetical protein
VLRTSRDENRRMRAFGARGQRCATSASSSVVVGEQRGEAALPAKRNR